MPAEALKVCITTYYNYYLIQHVLWILVIVVSINYMTQRCKVDVVKIQEERQ
jgi:uncharacterized membrane protein